MKSFSVEFSVDEMEDPELNKEAKGSNDGESFTCVVKGFGTFSFGELSIPMSLFGFRSSATPLFASLPDVCWLRLETGHNRSGSPSRKPAN